MIRFGNFTWKNSRFPLRSVAMLSLLIFAPTVAQAQGESIYAVDARNDQLRTMNPVTGAELATITITSGDGMVNGATGLAENPTTGTLWAMLKIGGGGFIGRVLVTLDPATGVATTVGDTGIAIAGIAFDGAGVLYGVSGDGANGPDVPDPSPETLYTISKADGSVTLVVVLGNGTDGETIAFNPNDGLIYHLSGFGAKVFETIDPASPTTAPVDIPLSGDGYSEAVSLVHWFGDLFLMADFGEIGVGDGRFYVLSTRGEVRALNPPATLGLKTKGAVFTGTPLVCGSLADLYGAAHQGPNGLSILYAINPTDGTPTAVGPIGFERVGAMAFDGNGILFGVGETMDGTDTSTLITVDPCTGAGTEIGPTNLFANTAQQSFSDISFRNADGVLYAYLEETEAVAVVDPVTGNVTSVGSTGFEASGNGIAFDAADTLWHAQTTTGQPGDLNTLDQATGTSTQITTTPFTAPADNQPRFNAMDFEPGTDILFGSLNDGQGGAPENHLATINTGDGTVTTLGQTVDGLDALAFRSKTDLAVTKTDDADPVGSGANITYTVTVTNNGPENAGGVTVTDTLPGSVTFGSATPTQGSCSESAGTVTCDFGAIATGASASADIVVTAPNSVTLLTNSADVSMAAIEDHTPANDSTSETTAVGDYAINASPASTVIATNSSGTITVTVTPAGTSFGNAVNLSCGALPAGVTCSFSPAQVTPGASAATSTLTITHAKKIGTTIPFAPFPIGTVPLGLLMAALLGLLTLSLFLVARRSPQFKLRVFLPAALLLGGVILLAACGGTKAVSYSATINATSGSIAKTTTVNVSTK